MFRLNKMKENINIFINRCDIYFNSSSRAGEGISEPLSDILYNMLSDELFKRPSTQIESLVLSCR